LPKIIVPQRIAALGSDGRFYCLNEALEVLVLCLILITGACLRRADRGDAAMAGVDSLLNGDISNILNMLSAAAGLGVASMGLVDSSKAINGGPSNFGFKFIENGVGPFLPNTSGALSKQKILATLRANWVNGVAKADQKAKALALIHLNLTVGNAQALATAAGVDGAKLASLAQKVAAGQSATPDELSVLGQFDVVVNAVLDEAYERGDQQYRNAAKLLATAVSTVLAVVTGALAAGSNYSLWSFGVSAVIGLSATPLAPMAKDLATTLQAAATAVGAVKR
jgi:hypothetical protein